MSKMRALQKDTTKKDIVLVVILVLGLAWVNTFIHQNSFSDGYGDFYYLKNFAIAAFYTGLYFWLFKDLFGSETLFDSTNSCVIYTAATGIFMLIAVLLELGTDWFSIYGQEDFIIGYLEIPKKYVYDIWAIVCFPINVNAVFRVMKKESFKFSSILNGCIVIVGMTVEGILLFRPLTNIWLIDLAILNVATIAIAVWKYVIPDTNIRKGNAVAGVILYAIFRAVLLPLQCNNWGCGLASVLYSGNWSEVKLIYSEIISNATFFGTSDYLKNSPLLHSWLANWNKPVLQLLYYGGWIAVFGLLFVIAVLILLLVKILGIKNGRTHKNWLIYATAVAMLADRAVLGTLYSFGVPVPVALPFLGKTGIMDAMALTLILYGVFENLQIQKHQKLSDTFVCLETMLGIQESYQVLNKDKEPYSEEDLFDDVTVLGDDSEIDCTAEWLRIEERLFCVFETRGDHDKVSRFILEFTDNRWIIPEDTDGEIRDQIIRKYMALYEPDCIEGEVEVTDEDFDDEDWEYL